MPVFFTHGKLQAEMLLVSYLPACLNSYHKYWIAELLLLLAYLNWGHTSTPSELEAYLRLSWKRSLQHSQCSLHPQGRDLQSATTFFSGGCCAVWGPQELSWPLLCVAVWCRRWSDPTAAMGRLVVHFYTLVCLSTRCASWASTGLGNIWCLRPWKAVPVTFWEMPLLFYHQRAGGEGNPSVTSLAIVPAVL